MKNIIIQKKTYITILLLFQFFQMNGQKTEKFYDFRWKECKANVARFYCLIEKTDSGYFRKDFYIKERKLQMLGNYKDSLFQIKTGKFYYFHATGFLKRVGMYVNNQKEGLWLSFHSNEMLSDSTVYLNDKQISTSLSWHPNGVLSDSVYTNEDGSGFSTSWFDNGVVSSRGKYSVGHKQDGLWKYFHKNGINSSFETYHDSKLIDKKYFDEDGIQMNDTTNHDVLARISDDNNDWFKYLKNNINFPSNERIINGDTAVVVVTFTVNENGIVKNVFSSTTFSEKFDRAAEEVIKNSPTWRPAIQHNRKVEETINQPIKFINPKKH